MMFSDCHQPMQTMCRWARWVPELLELQVHLHSQLHASLSNLGLHGHCLLRILPEALMDLMDRMDLMDLIVIIWGLGRSHSLAAHVVHWLVIMGRLLNLSLKRGALAQAKVLAFFQKLARLADKCVLLYTVPPTTPEIATLEFCSFAPLNWDDLQRVALTPPGCSWKLKHVEATSVQRCSNSFQHVMSLTKDGNTRVNPFRIIGNTIREWSRIAMH